MAVKRIVSTSFWTDSKIEKFTSEEKYFFLYLLTNPYTTQLGIYELPLGLTAKHLGWDEDKVKEVLKKFEDYGLIKYSDRTNEIAIKNFLRHSIMKGGKPVMDCLLKEKKRIKDKDLLVYIEKCLSSSDVNELNKTVIEFLEILKNPKKEEELNKEKPQKKKDVSNNRFNNFHQREYDMAKLEKELLNNG